MHACLIQSVIFCYPPTVVIEAHLLSGWKLALSRKAYKTPAGGTVYCADALGTSSSQDSVTYSDSLGLGFLVDIPHSSPINVMKTFRVTFGLLAIYFVLTLLVAQTIGMKISRCISLPLDGLSFLTFSVAIQ